MTTKSTLLLTTILFSLVSCRYAEVEKGKLYRSPQPTLEQLNEAHAKIQFKTIINLRGQSEGKSWYDEEAQFAKSNGINLVNIKMSAKTIPSRKNLLRLLDAFRNSERPILLHCRAGVDRTGEASAIYAMEYMGQTREKALEMLSEKFAHVDGISPEAKIYFIKHVWQGEEWARNEYFPCRQDYKHFDRKRYCGENGEELITEASDELVGDGDELVNGGYELYNRGDEHLNDGNEHVNDSDEIVNEGDDT